MATHNWILKCEQYTAHRNNKIKRRNSRNEIEFGVETIAELEEAQMDDYYVSYDTHLDCGLGEVDLQLVEYT